MTIIPESARLFFLSRTSLCFNSASLLQSGLISYNLDQRFPFYLDFLLSFLIKENPYIIYNGYWSRLFENNYVDNLKIIYFSVTIIHFIIEFINESLINLIACFVLMIGKFLRKKNI